MNNNKPKANILIVEDEDMMAKLLKDILAKLGYLVCQSCVSAKEAIKYTKTHKPDLVLMDIRLSGEMDGIEAAKRIYSELKIPVVFLTSYADDMLLERAKIAGSFGYMVKPFKERELVATIDMALYKAKLERKLAESEEKHRLFFENSPIGIIHYNNNGIITEINDSIISIFGSTREKLVGLDIGNIPDKKFSKEVYKSLKGEIGFYEGEYTSFTGKRTAIIKASWIPIIHGKVISGVGIIENITERKQAEKESRHSKELLRTVLDIIPTFICAKNLDGRFILVNKKLTDFYGTTVDEMTGILHADICKDENELQAMLAVDREVIESGKPKLIPEETMENPDGSITVLETYKIPFTTHDEPAVLIAATNITKRKQAEEEIRKLSKVAETTPEAIVITDMQGTIEYVNQGLLTLGGFEDNSLIIGKQVFMFSNEEGVKKLQEEIIPTILSDGKWRGEVPVKRKGGSIFPADMVCSLILDEEGKPKYLLSQYHDITKRKKAEEELRDKMNELEAFYRTTLGREGRVIELKQEVNELLEQLGKNKKYANNLDPK